MYSQLLGITMQELGWGNTHFWLCLWNLTVHHLCFFNIWLRLGIGWVCSDLKVERVKERWCLGTAIWGSKRLFCTFIFLPTVSFLKKIYSFGLLWELLLFLRWTSSQDFFFLTMKPLENFILVGYLDIQPFATSMEQNIQWLLICWDPEKDFTKC